MTGSHSFSDKYFCGVFAGHNSETIEKFGFIFRVFRVFRGFLF